MVDLSKLSRATDELTQSLGRKPTAADLADIMEASADQIKHLMDLRPDTSSLDDPIDDDMETFLGDVLEDENTVFPDDFAIRCVTQDEVHKVLRSLPERHQAVLQMRYGLRGGREHTLEEIGKKFNLTRQRVRQIEKAALEKMRCMDCPRLRPFVDDEAAF